MNKQIVTWGVVVLLTVGGIGCGGSSETGEAGEEAASETAATKAPENVEEAAKEAMKALGGNADVEPIDFRELKELLPEELSGMKRTNATGQKTGAMGMKLSMAEGKYAREDGARGNMTISITDLGTLKGLGLMGYAAWLNMEIDQESDTGYEKTTKYEGHPAYEKFNKSGSYPHGEMAVYVGQRFIVKVEGSGVEMDEVKEALKQIDVGKLDGMKMVGVK